MASPRTKQPTIIDVAERAGVSKSVVSRALRGQVGVNEETRTRVVSAAADLGYVANAMAVGLVKATTRTIGVILRDPTRAFYGELLAGMQSEAETSEYQLVSVTSAQDLGVEEARSALFRLISLRVDGLIVASAQLPAEHIVPYIDRVPVVIAGRHELSHNITSVFSDDEYGGRLMAERVLTLGHRHVAVILVEPSYSASQHARSAAMIRTLRAADASPEVWDVKSDGDARSVAAERIIDSRATAIMCPTDLVAVEVLEILRRRGQSAPNDISVTGYDGIGPLATDYLGLSTFQVPVRDIGKTAIALLVEKMREDNQPDRGVALKGTVSVGRTLGKPASTTAPATH
jgi:DNA-binding LacI/PurR family transcriptional regulator